LYSRAATPAGRPTPRRRRNCWNSTRRQGETEERLYLLNAWRESPLYTDRERAALAWTEAVTLIGETHAPDDLYEDVRARFSEAETVNLTMLIGAINAWNRLAISFRAIHPVKVKAAVA
jgi:alkylhydroperoxidase family enzyme